MSDDFVYDEGPVRYAVEYLIKGETRWRRTMEHPIDALMLQTQVLWENPRMAATRQVAIAERLRLLSAEELRSATHTAIGNSEKIGKVGK